MEERLPEVDDAGDDMVKDVPVDDDDYTEGSRC